MRSQGVLSWAPLASQLNSANVATWWNDDVDDMDDVWMAWNGDENPWIHHGFTMIHQGMTALEFQIFLRYVEVELVELVDAAMPAMPCAPCAEVSEDVVHRGNCYDVIYNESGGPKNMGQLLVRPVPLEFFPSPKGCQRGLFFHHTETGKDANMSSELMWIMICLHAK